LLQRLGNAADKIALQPKHLRRMPADCAISLMRWRPNGGKATAKLRQEIKVFDRVSSKLKYLHVMLANLSVLRQRCDEPRAKWGIVVSDLERMRPHLDFCAAAGWQVTASWCQRMP
jgi:hypothetical protein